MLSSQQTLLSRTSVYLFFQYITSLSSPLLYYSSRVFVHLIHLIDPVLHAVFLLINLSFIIPEMAILLYLRFLWILIHQMRLKRVYSLF
jgi:hypothetical protein